MIYAGSAKRGRLRITAPAEPRAGLAKQQRLHVYCFHSDAGYICQCVYFRTPALGGPNGFRSGGWVTRHSRPDTTEPLPYKRSRVCFATVILPALCCGSVWWRQDEALTDTQDVWITRTNHGASCVTPAALRHNSAGGLRVLNGVTHSGWWGRGNVDSVRLRVHSSVGCTRPLFLAAWFCNRPTRDIFCLMALMRLCWFYFPQ